MQQEKWKAIRASNKFGLRRLIVFLSLFGILLTLLNVLYATYKVQRQLLIDTTLESNMAYAGKIAQHIDIQFTVITGALKWGAQELSQKPNNLELREKEVKRILNQVQSFTSVIVVDSKGKILSKAHKVSLDERLLKSHQVISEATKQKEVFVSPEFRLQSNSFYILTSQPIIDSQGQYHGYIGGIVDLQANTIMSRVINKHIHTDGTYTYVVDMNRQLIAHRDTTRVGEQIKSNLAIEQVLQNETGSIQAFNSLGVEMLAGYAPIEHTHWGVVSQKPLDITLEGLKLQMVKVLVTILPIFTITLILVWVFASRISKPLYLLAKEAENLENPNIQVNLQKIQGWYHEAHLIKTALHKGVAHIGQHLEQLRTESHTDPLTNLLNRRGLQNSLDSLIAGKVPFSIISLDIDHFKKVNDTFGHDIGDYVLQDLAKIMLDTARNTDLSCRAGGEEFLIILPSTSLDKAINLADRLRVNVELNQFKKVGTITISLGVTHWPANDIAIEDYLKLADQALYKAKQTGRNKVVALESLEEANQE